MSDVVYMLPSAPGLNLQGRKERREQNWLGCALRQAIKSIGSHLGGCFMCLSRSRCSFKMRRSRLDFLPCEGLDKHESELGGTVSNATGQLTENWAFSSSSCLARRTSSSTSLSRRRRRRKSPDRMPKPVLTLVSRRRWSSFSSSKSISTSDRKEER